MSKDHFTGMRFFRLCLLVSIIEDRPTSTHTHVSGCAGFPPWHVVCSFTSASDDGGPLVVYVGVSDGSQKSGSLLFNASACSRSICRRAASSASRVSFSTAVASKSNFRFVPRAVD